MERNQVKAGHQMKYLCFTSNKHKKQFTSTIIRSQIINKHFHAGIILIFLSLNRMSHMTQLTLWELFVLLTGLLVWRLNAPNTWTSLKSSYCVTEFYNLLHMRMMQKWGNFQITVFLHCFDSWFHLEKVPDGVLKSLHTINKNHRWVSKEKIPKTAEEHFAHLNNKDTQLLFSVLELNCWVL